MQIEKSFNSCLSDMHDSLCSELLYELIVNRNVYRLPPKMYIVTVYMQIISIEYVVMTFMKCIYEYYICRLYLNSIYEHYARRRGGESKHYIEHK